jgi:methylmalonyl-CoA carboxyltransferase small subunit
LKLRITIEGKTYEAEVEILESEESDSAPAYTAYPPIQAAYPAVPIPSPSTQAVREDGHKVSRSPVTGLVIKVNVEPGQAVEQNDLLMVLEAMKMETHVTAMHAGTVKSVKVVAGNSVKVHQPLIEFE